VHPPDFIAQLVKMYQQGDLPLEKICRKYHYKDFQKAIDAMHDGSVIKPILVFD
jgi:aryl-alcohol dehydrogenase